MVDAHGDAASELSISFHGVPIQGTSVSSLQLYFWNAGKEPIRSGDVLRTLRINMPQGATILTTRVVNVTRDVCNFRVSPMANGLKQAIDLSFDIAEKGDGARIQITYAGPPDVTPSFSGTVIGVQSLSLEKTPISEKPISAKKAGRLDQALAALIAVSTVTTGLLSLSIPRQRKTPGFAVTFPVTATLATVLLWTSFATVGVPVALRP